METKWERYYTEVILGFRNRFVDFVSVFRCTRYLSNIPRLTGKGEALKERRRS
jgi:hypothetical protein